MEISTKKTEDALNACIIVAVFGFIVASIMLLHEETLRAAERKATCFVEKAGVYHNGDCLPPYYFNLIIPINE